MLTADHPVAPTRGRTAPPERRTRKRVAELPGRLMAAGILAVAVPVLLICAAGVRATSAGPAFYSQRRQGRRGREFAILKLRTMRVDAEAQTGPVWSRQGDLRVTKLGHLLRRSHLDELPQLWNVVAGHMNFIGPRPERPAIAEDLVGRVPGYRQRLAIKPGITGLAQIILPADSHTDDVRRKLAADLYYIRHRSLWLDACVLAGTLLKVLGLPQSAIAAATGFGELRRELLVAPRAAQPVALSARG